MSRFKEKLTLRGRIPSVAAKRGEPNLLYDYGVCVHSKTLQLVGEIDEQMLRRVMAACRHLDSLQPQQALTIELYTSGGDINCGLAIFDYLRALRSEVRIIGFGRVESMGVVLLQAADTGLRLLSKYARIMMHKGTGMIETTHVTDLERNMKEIKEIGLLGDRILAERTGISFTRLRKEFVHDTYMSANIAVEVGFADAIYEG